MGLIAASAALILLSAFLALNWAVVGASGYWAQARVFPAGRPWAWALAWTAAAVVTERWTPRLSIDLLGYTQYRYLALIQLGALAGPHALGFLLVGLNASLAQVWKSLAAKRGASPAPLALALGLLGAVFIWGRIRLDAKAASSPDVVRVEILQPVVDQYQKWNPLFAAEIFRNFTGLLAAPRATRPDLVVWPESALPELVYEDQPLPLASEAGRKLGAWQAVGVVSEDRARRLYSAALLLDAEGKARGSYHKRQLVPFGEYIPPGFGWLRSWIGILNELGGVTPGEAAQPLLPTPLGLTAVSLCYEAVFPRWANFDAGRGARAIINLTNDGWYKDTWGPYQHFQTNVFRAVENGVTVIRAGNTGISAVIDPWGRVTARLDLNVRGRLDASVPRDDPFPDRTFYARHGDWFGLSCVAMAFLLSVAGMLKPGRPIIRTSGH